MQSTLAPSNIVELPGHQRHTLKRTGQRPISFDGVKLAEAETSAERTNPDWSGEVGFCHRAAIYRTAGGHYVLEYVTHVTPGAWRGEVKDSYQVFTADTLDELLDIVEDKNTVAHRVANLLIEELGSKMDIAEELD